MKIESSTRTIVAILDRGRLRGRLLDAPALPEAQGSGRTGDQGRRPSGDARPNRSNRRRRETARKDFSKNYQQLVVPGKAVPAGPETASLLVQANRPDLRAIRRSNSEHHPGAQRLGDDRSRSVDRNARRRPRRRLADRGGSLAAAARFQNWPGRPRGDALRPDLQRQLLPRRRLHPGIDSLVDAENERVAVNGRLVTLDGFSLAVDATRGFPYLDANFSVTTYIVPPSQGVTAGATPTSPAPAEEAPKRRNRPKGPNRLKPNRRNDRRHTLLRHHRSQMNFLKKGPELKIPDKMPDVKLPEWASDIYVELRERHLLPLVVVLVVAIVAVPIALGESAKPSRPRRKPQKRASRPRRRPRWSSRRANPGCATTASGSAT